MGHTQAKHTGDRESFIEWLGKASLRRASLSRA